MSTGLPETTRVRSIEWTIVYALWVVLTAASLSLVWGVSFLPLEDYPQHLLQAKLVAQRLSGLSLHPPVYQVHVHFAYSLCYVLI